MDAKVYPIPAKRESHPDANSAAGSNARSIPHDCNQGSLAWDG
jgi:hypothetical protein